MIIVTGGAGFIGANIVHRLAPQADVVVCDRLEDASLGKWRNLLGAPLADLIAPEALFPFMDGRWRAIDAVVHMGAISSTTETDVDRIVAANVTLSKAVWDWCARHRKPLVYASSAATYGAGEQGFKDANEPDALQALRPLNAYGWSKQAFDMMALRMAAKGEAPPLWSGLKFFNVYGPHERHKGAQKSVVAGIYPKVAAGEAVQLFKSHHPDYPDGGQKRDFVHVRDCVDVAEWLLKREIQGGLLNVGAGAARTFADLAGATFAAAKKKPKIEFIDTPMEIRANYQYFTEADITRLRALGYDKAMTTLEAGVADYVKTDLSRAHAQP